MNLRIISDDNRNENIVINFNDKTNIFLIKICLVLKIPYDQKDTLIIKRSFYQDAKLKRELLNLIPTNHKTMADIDVPNRSIIYVRLTKLDVSINRFQHFCNISQQGWHKTIKTRPLD